MQTRMFYCSDLHLDHLWRYYRSAVCDKMFEMLPEGDTSQDILVIAGDLANDDTITMSYAGKSWLKVVSGRFRDIVMTHGNHSFFLTEFDNMEAKFDKLLAEQNITNVHVLRDSSWQDAITGVLFIGGTLWTDLDRQNPLIMYQVAYQMNDYRYIRNRIYHKITPLDTLVKHLDTVAYLRDALSKNKGMRTIVVTHHLPSEQLIAEQYKGQLLNACYASSLDELIMDNPQIETWIYGHTHTSNDLMIGNTRCVSNPFGYAGENKQYDITAHIVLDNLVGIG